MAASGGVGYVLSGAAGARICRDCEELQWRTPWDNPAISTGRSPVGDSPSMVTILSLCFTSLTSIEHERCTSPLMCTEHAPHWPMPQPYLVPVSPACSRKAQRRGVSPSTVRSTDLPLMFSLATLNFPGADNTLST